MLPTKGGVPQPNKRTFDLIATAEVMGTIAEFVKDYVACGRALKPSFVEAAAEDLRAAQASLEQLGAPLRSPSRDTVLMAAEIGVSIDADMLLCALGDTASDLAQAAKLIELRERKI